jgi:hypothetical protein
MDIRQFYSIYLPALNKALQEDYKNYGFCVYSPEYYVGEDKLVEIESFIDNELANNKFVNMVDEYFDAKSHNFKKMDGVDLDTIKDEIVKRMGELQRMYSLE